MLQKNKIQGTLSKILLNSLALGVLMSNSVFADDVEIYVEEPPTPLPPNVLFILDESGSMGWDTDSNWVPDTDPTQRNYRLRAALKDLFDDTDMENITAGLLGYTAGTTGIRVLSDFKLVADHRIALKASVDTTVHGGGTPTVLAISTGVDWFKDDLSGQTSPIGTDPKNNWCRSNHIVLLTDGRPNSNTLTTYPTASDTCASDTLSRGADGQCAREISAWGYAADLKTGGAWDTGLAEGKKQNITTHTIGFDTSDVALENFMKSVADNGGPSAENRYYPATSADELAEVFKTIIAGAITNIEYTYNAPVIPFNPSDTAVSGEFVYVPIFEPGVNKFWKGNLKKYKFSTDDDGIKIMNDSDVSVTDPDTLAFVDSNDLWNSGASDEAKALVGGAASHMTGTRVLYSNIDAGEPRLTEDVNRVTDSNSTITAAMLASTPERTAVLNWVNWIDISATHPDVESLEGKMGALLHSKPVVVEYSGGDLVFVTGTDGILKAINTSDGTEVWSFIPQDLLSGLPTIFTNAEDTIPYYGLDGPITSYEVGSNKYLVFGMRRGGHAYYALDITSRSSPVFAWKIDNTSTGFTNMGQTWSKPLFVKMNFSGTGGGEEDVLVFGGGYDENQDATTIRVDDTEGNSIFIINPVTGALIKDISNTGADLNITDMKNGIAGDILAVDINANGVIDRLYAAGVGGRIIRVDIPDSKFIDHTFSGSVIADINADATSSDFRRFFNTPEVGFFSKGSAQYLPILIGSGNRPNPKSTAVIDRFYMIQDKAVWRAPLDDTNGNGVKDAGETIDYHNVGAYESNASVDASGFFVAGTNGGELYNATANLVQDGTATEKLENSVLVKGDSGWFIDLSEAEKSFSKAKLYASVVLFTTFSSELTDDIDRCVINSAIGISNLYAVSLTDATAVFAEFDGDDSTLAKSDRTPGGLKIPGLPPSPGLVFGEKKTRAIVGLEDIAEWDDRFHAIFWEEVLDE